mmetsp:Transcript_5085/g.19061  ORF Transcript_5085/g.19061 Transcript_5085/m.19061 type:complete len:135 (+) Transcript_5085:1897-2301(+)
MRQMGQTASVTATAFTHRFESNLYALLWRKFVMLHVDVCRVHQRQWPGDERHVNTRKDSNHKRLHCDPQAWYIPKSQHTPGAQRLSFCSSDSSLDESVRQQLVRWSCRRSSTQCRLRILLMPWNSQLLVHGTSY